MGGATPRDPVAGGPPRPREIDRRYPLLARTLPRVDLGDWPTPLETTAAFAEQAGLPALLLKRDDRGGSAYGGNKVRKLEYLLAEAKASGADAVLTFGAVGSNHALATAVYARQLGLTCYAVLTPQPPTPHVADTLRWHVSLGTRLATARTFDGANEVAEALRAAHPGGPGRVYTIPWGGTSWLGAVGFVAAGLELAGQLEALGLPAPERLYVPCGTMGTVAGLGLGLQAAGLRTTVVAVKVVPRASVDPAGIRALMEETNRELCARDPAFPVIPQPAAQVALRTDALGPGYARPTPAALEAIALAGAAGLKLDVTYSGKAFAALLGDARRAPASSPWLFWLTLNARPLPAAAARLTPADIPGDFREYLAPPL